MGRALAESAARAGFDTLLTTRSGAGSTTPLDVTRWGQVKEVVGQVRPQVIFNCAALTNVDGCENNSEMARAVNRDGAAHLLEMATAVGARLVQVSTDYVFDGRNGPYLEEDPTSPLGIYGQTKLAAEELIGEEGGHLIVRANVLFSHAGGSQASFVTWVAKSLAAGESIRVVTDQVGNPTYAPHLADALVLAVQKGADGLYHYGGLEFASRFSFAKTIARILNLDETLIEPVSTQALGQIAPRPLHSGLICSRMKMDLGVKNFNLNDALQAAFEGVN